MAGGRASATTVGASPGSTRAVDARALARARGHADHGPRRLRRRRRLLDGDPRARAARARRRRRLVPAQPHRGRLRAQRRDGRAAGRARHAAAAHRRLRDHRGRRGRAGARRRAGRRRHRPPQPARRRRRCPTRRSCTRRVCGYPCPDLCAAGVAYKLAAALLAGAGRDPAGADEDLDLVALATVADCVPLRGENRRLVREGLHALAATRQAGAARADARRQGRPGRARRARDRLPPRAAHQRRRAPVPRRRRRSSCCSPTTPSAPRRSPTSSTTPTPSAATSRRGSSSRPRRRCASSASSPPTCWRARAGTPGSSGSSPRGSPSATTARA